MIHFQCPDCGNTIKCDDRYAGRTGHCPKCKSTVKVPSASPEAAPPLQVPTAESESSALPYDLKGDRLGMSLDEFKRKHHRVVPGHNETAPVCSDSRPGKDMMQLLSKAYYSEVGLVNCRLDFPFEQEQGMRPAPTVAGVKTQWLIYEFVDQQLFRIMATFSNEYFEQVSEALKAKYGTPNGGEEGKQLIWTNGVSSIAFRKGRLKRDPSILFFVHEQLQETAESRRPGPAVHDL